MKYISFALLLFFFHPFNSKAQQKKSTNVSDKVVVKKENITKPKPLSKEKPDVQSKNSALKENIKLIDKGLNRRILAEIQVNPENSLIYNLDTNGVESIKRILKVKFTESELLNILERAKIENYPQGINTSEKISTLSSDAFYKDRRAFMDAKFYVQASFVLNNANIIDLLWMPMADNPNLPSQFKPSDNGDGFYFVINSKVYHKLGIENELKKTQEFINQLKAKNIRQPLEKVVYNNALPHYHSLVLVYKDLKSNGYSEEEMIRMIELSNTNYKPEDISDYFFTDEKLNIYSKYTTYLIAQAMDGEKYINLSWIPKEQSIDIPTNLLPKSEEGFYIFSYSENIKPVTTKAKYTTEQVYKAEEVLINYLNTTDKELNPLLAKILRSGKDAWILYKTKERAHSLINSQINECKTFLKEYGKYTTVVFKEGVETRLAQSKETYSSF